MWLLHEQQETVLSNACLVIIAYILWQVHSLFQNKFSRECDLVLPLSACSIFLFQLGYP
jgi:hypothetical protein